MRIDATPWARAAIDADLEAQVRGADPRDAQMHLGRGPEQWRALVTWHGHTIAEVRDYDLNRAVREALRAV